MKGCLGYPAPEYAVHEQLSEKVDTYSYGIVILEIIGGRKSSELLNYPDSEFLLKLMSPDMYSDLTWKHFLLSHPPMPSLCLYSTRLLRF